MNNYLLKCESLSLIEKRITDIINEKGFKDSLITTYDLDEDSIVKVIEDANTISFLTEKKVIIVKNFTTKNLPNDKDIIELTKYLENANDEVLLIITTTNIDSRKKIIKDLLTKLNFINITKDPKDLIKDIFKDYKIEQKVTNLLIEYYSDDIERLMSEANKLKLVFIDTKNITYDIAKDVLIKPLNNQDNLAFDLVREIALKNKKNAIRIYNELIDYKVESYSLIGLLESQYRLLYQLKVLTKNNISSKDMADILEVHPFRVKKTLELTSFYTLKEIKEFILKLNDIDYKIKSGAYENNIVIDLLLLNIK